MLGLEPSPPSCCHWDAKQWLQRSSRQQQQRCSQSIGHGCMAETAAEAAQPSQSNQSAVRATIITLEFFRGPNSCRGLGAQQQQHAEASDWPYPAIVVVSVYLYLAS
jgi:hypothetical protein